MTAYEYICSNCKNTIKKYQQVNDKSVKLCPFCRKNKLEKQIIDRKNK